MKKYLCAALVTTMATTVAFGSSISVPFFLDWESIGFRGIVGLKNNTSQDIEISVFYRDGQGQNRTPGPPPLGNFGADNFVDQQNNAVGTGYNSDAGNTYILEANAAIGWRPATTSDPRDPGFIPAVDTGITVPTMMGSQVFVQANPGDPFVLTLGQGEFSPYNGSVEVRWFTVTSERDVQGRYLETNTNTGARASYLLPPGITVD
jgi:hypothetical protein